MSIARRDTLTQAELKDILSFDPETGIFTWVNSRGGRVKGSVAGCHRNTKKPDVVIKLKKVMFLAHRLAWLYVHGVFPEGVIDHINGNPADNRIRNLRDVSQRVNSENRKSAQVNNRLGVLGVSTLKSGAIRATLTVNRKQVNLGQFPDVESAHRAYLEAKRALHVGNTL